MNRSRPSYTTVIAHLALFAALGGSAFAATKVGSKDIRDNSIQGRDVKNRTLTHSDIKPRSLTARDFRAGQIPAGPAGPQGVQGPPGSNGAPGAPGTAGADAAAIQTGRVETLSDFGEFGGGPLFAYPQGETPDNGFTVESKATELSPAVTIVARDLFVREDHISTMRPYTPRAYVLRVNGADSALSCFTTGSTINPTGTVACSDTTHAVTIAPGSTLSLKIVEPNYTSGGAGMEVLPVRFGWVAASN